MIFTFIILNHQILQWITQQAAKDTQHLSVRTAFVQHDNGSISTRFNFVPGTGFHYFKWNNIWFQVRFISPNIMELDEYDRRLNVKEKIPKA